MVPNSLLAGYFTFFHVSCTPFLNFYVETFRPPPQTNVGLGHPAGNSRSLPVQCPFTRNEI